jgi:hypothetical protein
MSQLSLYTGIWQDHSHTAMYGATLTLSIRYGNILISVLTVAVTISATCFWIITSFLLHQFIVRGQNTDVVGLQHQVILRNSSSILGSLWEIIKVHLAWRHSASRSLLRQTVILAFPIAIIWSLFTVASILVSDVASKSYVQTHALLRPQNCGYWWIDVVPGRLDGAAKILEDTLGARIYANHWYGNSSTKLASTSLLPVDTVPYSTWTRSFCPFDNARCVPNFPSFTIETDILDSHETFGINAPLKDRVQLQKRLECANIVTGDLWEKNGTDLLFYFGPAGDYNYTFRYNPLLSTEPTIDYILK